MLVWVGIINLSGFFPLDMEDISMASVVRAGGRREDFLMVADFGNNFAYNRTTFSIYIFPEPDIQQLERSVAQCSLLLAPNQH